MKVDIAVGNVVIFAVLNVDCVDRTPFETWLSNVEMSSKDKIDTSSVEVEIDVEDTVVVSVADVVVGVCVFSCQYHLSQLLIVCQVVESLN